MKKKKTIFFLINSMGSGGAERVLSNILPSLSNKYKIYLLLLKGDCFYDIPKNIKTISLSKINNNLLMTLLFPLYIYKLRMLKQKYKPIKIISFLEISNFINILANKNAIISSRISLSFFEQSDFIGKIYLILIKLLYPRANKVVTNSEENRLDFSKKINIPLAKITTIYNPVNINQIAKLKNETVELPFQKQGVDKIFITIGRLDKQKSLDTIIGTFKNTPTNDKLLIIGEGLEKQNLQNLIRKYHLRNKVFLLGRKKNVYKYLNIADYFIFSSMAEGFPNVLIEAMACNLPIITSDFKTGAREVIDPKLKFNTKIKYPYYGPNGVLLNLDNFEKDFKNTELIKILRNKRTINNFQIKKIIYDWEEMLRL